MDDWELREDVQSEIEAFGKNYTLMKLLTSLTLTNTGLHSDNCLDSIYQI